MVVNICLLALSRHLKRAIVTEICMVLMRHGLSCLKHDVTPPLGTLFYSNCLNALVEWSERSHVEQGDLGSLIMFFFLWGLSFYSS